jgi:hypothetical protein
MLDISDCYINTPESEFAPIRQLRHLPNLEALDLSKSCFEDAVGLAPRIHRAIQGLASVSTLRALNLINSTFLMDLMMDVSSWPGVCLPLNGLTSLKLSQPQTQLWTWWDRYHSANVYDASIAAWRAVAASVKQVRLQFVDLKFSFWCEVRGFWTKLFMISYVYQALLISSGQFESAHLAPKL